MVNRIENIGLENRDRNMEALCVILDHLAVLRAVSRIHDNEFYFEIKFTEALTPESISPSTSNLFRRKYRQRFYRPVLPARTY